jgi:hypothetical protein
MARSKPLQGRRTRSTKHGRPLVSVWLAGRESNRSGAPAILVGGRPLEVAITDTGADKMWGTCRRPAGPEVGRSLTEWFPARRPGAGLGERESLHVGKGQCRHGS